MTPFTRPDPTLVKDLSRFSAATIHEAQGHRGALALSIQAGGPSHVAVRPCLHSCAQPGDVIVVSAGEYTEAGSFSDLLATACLAKDLAGLVTDTGLRDTAELRKPRTSRPAAPGGR